MNFIQKSQQAHMSIPPPRVELSGARKIDVVEILFFTKSEKHIQFRAQRCQKYASNQKKASYKSCLELNFAPKNPKRICLSPSGVELGGWKDWHVRSVIMYVGKGKLHSILDSTLPKIRITRKKSFK